FHQLLGLGLGEFSPRKRAMRPQDREDLLCHVRRVGEGDAREQLDGSSLRGVREELRGSSDMTSYAIIGAGCQVKQEGQFTFRERSRPTVPAEALCHGPRYAGIPEAEKLP